MQILHTADLHLSDKNPKTLEALRVILKKAEEYKVDLLTIAGDIFDSDEDANILRPILRKFFSNLDFDIVAIPGNHDQSCYLDNLDFGSNFRIITGHLRTIEFDDDVLLCALPYTPRLTSELFSQLKETVVPSKTNILLLHCTLDIGFSSSDMGSERDVQYFPISPQVLAELGYKFILAGHFHKNTINKDIGNDTFFVYPGSPCSITTKETKKRAVVLVDTKKETVNAIPMETFYYDSLEVMVYPNKEYEAINNIRSWLQDHSMDWCELEIIVKGFGRISEKDFSRELSQITSNKVKVNIVNEYRDISVVLNHPIYQQFKDILNNEDLERKQVQNIDSIVIEIFSNLIARGDIKLE